MRDQCTRSKTGGRTLSLQPRELQEVLDHARLQQSDEQWRAKYGKRAGIEGTIHQAVAVTGIRRARYLGLQKTHLEHVFSAVALNLIRLDAWWNGTAPASATWPASTSHSPRDRDSPRGRYSERESTWVFAATR
ncbi:hypothetical protein AR457_36210 [Streptomyces agglomeratus]|uniref:transposase n=1 Tax=Streptomyces agglomeratus TaxID=285458 RepID=UPI00085509CC|nr:transposase [Streptomyces agglomeratus]OEJ22728.1 hypothetical protein AR457_36210 [Streptomyces agglomeratus]OEJ36672.1 hypothetical protein BGK72_36585 [Streptomyces agglomeratus]OEJ56397.1 hypothetical protein BGM19_37510 [Streptomyces agglomeratus]